jgi:integrase
MGMVRNSHQDALTEPEFKRLLQAADEFDEPLRRQCRFILICAGRLGMRAGEICHFKEHWIDWGRQQIHIPHHEPCDCGYCRSQAWQSVNYNPDQKEFDDVFAEFWSPKTENSARAVPFDFSDEIEEVIEAFTFYEDSYDLSRASVNRRVDKILEAAGMPAEKCYPHALRATAASWHAYRGLPAVALQSLMGWSNLDVAQKYIRLSGGATAKALKNAHQD